MALLKLILADKQLSRMILSDESHYKRINSERESHGQATHHTMHEDWDYPTALQA